MSTDVPYPFIVMWLWDRLSMKPVRVMIVCWIARWGFAVWAQGSHAANGGAVLGAGGARGKNVSQKDLGSRFVGRF